MRLAYFGTPAESVPPLEALVAAGHDVALVVTQPDRKRGRGGRPVRAPVKLAALDLSLRVITPDRAHDIAGDLEATAADVGVVVAFGQILPAELLAMTPLGFVNLHFSLLPRWRGAAPVERAILAGDERTGVALMRVEAGLDTGPVFASVETAIGADETSGELGARLVALGTSLLVGTLPHVAQIEPVPQSGEPTYAHKLTVDEFRLDPLRPAAELARLVRAGNPRPGAWAMLGGRRLKVLRVQPSPTAAPEPGVVDAGAVLGCATGALLLEEVQPEGKPVMKGAAWRSGRRGDVRLDA